MSEITSIETALNAARKSFAKEVEVLRPALHRYCSRMVGSALDGEDIVQETLAQAFFKLSFVYHDLQVRPWLFKIAHHKCIDFLRARQRGRMEPLQNELEDTVTDAAPHSDTMRQALDVLVSALPPKERASVILKDVLDQSLEEIAATLELSVGAVKAALHRGREKLASRPAATRPVTDASPLLQQYMNLFNNRDWSGLRAMAAGDASYEVVGACLGLGLEQIEGSYFTNYKSWPADWRMSLVEIDGETCILCREHGPDGARPTSLIRVEFVDGKIQRIRDYFYSPYIFENTSLQPSPYKCRSVHTSASGRSSQNVSVTSSSTGDS